MVARQHPGEAMAEWFVEGFLNRLTDPHDAAAMRVLENAVFYVVRACSLNRIAPGQAWVLTSFSFCVIMHEASLSSCAALLTVSWLLVGKLLGSSILCFSYYALMLQCSQCVAACGHAGQQRLIGLLVHTLCRPVAYVCFQQVHCVVCKGVLHANLAVAVQNVLHVHLAPLCEMPAALLCAAAVSS